MTRSVRVRKHVSPPRGRASWVDVPIELRVNDACNERRGPQQGEEAPVPGRGGFRRWSPSPAPERQGDAAEGGRVRLPRPPGEEAEFPQALHHPTERRRRDARPPLQPPGPRPAPG